MRSTYMTKQDKEFMDLRDKVKKVIPYGSIDHKTKRQQAKKWRAFKEYMDFYYKNLKG